MEEKHFFVVHTFVSDEARKKYLTPPEKKNPPEKRAIPEQLPEELLQQETMLDCKTQLKEIFSEALADLSRMEAMTK